MLRPVRVSEDRTAHPPAGNIDTSDRSVPALLGNYEYPIRNWPLIISRSLADKLEQLTVVLPRLLARIPSLYFKESVKEIADFYFEGNEKVTQFALLC